SVGGILGGLRLAGGLRRHWPPSICEQRRRRHHHVPEHGAAVLRSGQAPGRRRCVPGTERYLDRTGAQRRARSRRRVVDRGQLTACANPSEKVPRVRAPATVLSHSLLERVEALEHLGARSGGLRQQLDGAAEMAPGLAELAELLITE